MKEYAKPQRLSACSGCLAFLSGCLSANCPSKQRKHTGGQPGDYVGLSLRSTAKILKQISKLPASASPRKPEYGAARLVQGIWLDEHGYFLKFESYVSGGDFDILWIARTGSPWRDPMSSAIETEASAASAAGAVRVSGGASLRRCGTIRTSRAVDSRIIRAHQHASSAKEGSENQAIGRSRGGLSTKIIWPSEVSAGALHPDRRPTGDRPQAYALIDGPPDRHGRRCLRRRSPAPGDGRQGRRGCHPKPARGQKHPIDKHLAPSAT